jgi:hypothetical protein
VGALLALVIATACGGEATENGSGGAAEPTHEPNESEVPELGILRFRVHNGRMNPLYVLTSGYACLAVELRALCADDEECDVLNTEYVDSPCEGAGFGCDDMAQGTFSRVEPGESVVVSIPRDPSWEAGTYYADLGYAPELCGEQVCAEDGFSFNTSVAVEALCPSNSTVKIQFDLRDAPASENVELDLQL